MPPGPVRSGSVIDRCFNGDNRPGRLARGRCPPHNNSNKRRPSSSRCIRSTPPWVSGSSGLRSRGWTDEPKFRPVIQPSDAPIPPGDRNPGPPRPFGPHPDADARSPGDRLGDFAAVFHKQPGDRSRSSWFSASVIPIAIVRLPGPRQNGARIARRVAAGGPSWRARRRRLIVECRRADRAHGSAPRPASPSDSVTTFTRQWMP